MSAIPAIFDAILAERGRQERIGEAKRATGVDWRSCADPLMAGGDAMRLTVLAEEFGEVARAILEAGFAVLGDHDLELELVQVCAVGTAWLEAIVARRPGSGS